MSTPSSKAFGFCTLRRLLGRRCTSVGGALSLWMASCALPTDSASGELPSAPMWRVDASGDEVTAVERMVSAAYVTIEAAPPPHRLRASMYADDERNERYVFAPDGRALWVSWSEGQWEQVSLCVAQPSGPSRCGAHSFSGYSVRLLPVHEYPGMVFALAFGRHAWLVDTHPAADPNLVERFPLEWANASRQTSSAGVAAGYTAALRWMKTCPQALRTCLLFGAPNDVSAAIDPFEPPGGFSLVHEKSRETARVEFREPGLHASTRSVELHERIHLMRADRPARSNGEFDFEPETLRFSLKHIATQETIAKQKTIAKQETMTRVHAFDFERDWHLSGDELQSGVEDTGARLMLWVWDQAALRLGVSFHDRITGAQLEAHVVRAEPYYEPMCGGEIWGTRPIPVLDRQHRLHIALYWGSGDALLFDGIRSRTPSRAGADKTQWGRFVTVEDESLSSPSISEPAYLRLVESPERLVPNRLR